MPDQALGWRVSSAGRLPQPTSTRSGITIAEDSPEQSDARVDRLDAKLRVLATQPTMGRAREELAPGLCSLPFGRYVIFYLPLPDGIDVVRVLHSARDIDALFGEEPRES